MGADALFLLQFESLEQDLHDRVNEQANSSFVMPMSETS